MKKENQRLWNNYSKKAINISNVKRNFNWTTSETSVWLTWFVMMMMAFFAMAFFSTFFLFEWLVIMSLFVWAALFWIVFFMEIAMLFIVCTIIIFVEVVLFLLRFIQLVNDMFSFRRVTLLETSFLIELVTFLSFFPFLFFRMIPIDNQMFSIKKKKTKLNIIAAMEAFELTEIIKNNTQIHRDAFSCDLSSLHIRLRDLLCRDDLSCLFPRFQDADEISSNNVSQI